MGIGGSIPGKTENGRANPATVPRPGTGDCDVTGPIHLASKVQMPDENDMSEITVVSVAYNSFDVLPGMAESLPAGVPLAIVDNGPDDGLRAWAEAAGHRVVVPPRNLGFGTACNLGAAGVATPFLLFLNPDARLRPDTLAALLAAAERHPEASAFGAALTDSEGRLSYKRRSRLAPRDGAGPKAVPRSDTVVPALSGAAMMVRRAAFEAVGGFDPQIFFYYEDDDLSLRLRAGQGPLVFVPSAVVTHFSGQSSPPSAALSRFKGYHWARSRIHAARKHGAAFPRLSGFLNALWHLLAPRSWRSRERRNEAIGRLRGALSTLRA